MPVSTLSLYLTANWIPAGLGGTDAQWVGACCWAQALVALDAGTAPGLRYAWGFWCMDAGRVGNWTLCVSER